MLALAQAGYKHKIRAETVIPELERPTAKPLDNARRCRHVQRFRCAFVCERHGVKQLNLTSLEQTLDLFTRLGRVRRTRDVRENASGTCQRDSSIEEFALENSQLLHVRGRAVPTGLGAAAHRPHARAGGIDDDTVKRAEGPCALATTEGTTVAAHDLDGVELACRALHEAGAVRVHLVGGYACSRACSKAGEKRGLTAGTRTQVEPALVGAALERCGRGDERRKLRSLILCAGTAVANRGQARGIARMVEQDEYCIDIMTQISAVTSALKAVSMALLKDHLEHCVAAAVREGGDAAQEKFDEAMTAISRLAR